MTGPSFTAGCVVPPLPLLVAVVASELGLTLEDMHGRSRRGLHVLGRGMAVYVARFATPCSYPEIARALGRDSHSTVVFAHKRIEGLVRAGAVCDVGCGFGALPVAELSRLLYVRVLERWAVSLERDSQAGGGGA